MRERSGEGESAEPASRERANWRVEPFGLVQVPHPAKPPEVAVNIFLHAKYHRSPANCWLRGVVFELFGSKGFSPRVIRLSIAD